MSLGLSQSRRVARSYAVGAIGDVTLVIGYGQRHCLRLREFRMVTGSEAVSAIGNVALAVGDIQFGGLRLSQGRVIAGLTPSFAGRQVLRGIGRLCKCEN